MGKYQDILQNFTIQTLPDLHEVTLGALELFEHSELPSVDYHRFKRPLVIGSGNAAVCGKLLFDDVDAIFCDESTYLEKLSIAKSSDGAFLISASGGKHAIEIARKLKERSIETVLLTNNPHAPAREFFPADAVYVFLKNREPYTYNTSTYMGMILSKTNEDTRSIKEYIETKVAPLVSSDLSSYGAFYFIVRDEFTEVREMFKTKFDELFGPKLMARIFTFEQTKHAKTVIPHESELFVSFGVDNNLFGVEKNRLFIPLPDGADYAAMMAIGYYFIGHIQKQFPPYFKERIEEYAKETSTAFGSAIHPIVE